MNPDTGEIGSFESTAKAKKAGFTEELTPLESTMLAAMTTEERKAWLAEERRSGRRKDPSALHPSGKNRKQRRKKEKT